MVKAAKQAGLEVTGSFILGIPGETKEDAISTINFAKDSGFDFAQYTDMTPYPGTKIYETAKSESLIVNKDWSKYTTIKPVMETRDLDINQISRLISLAYRKFYLRREFLWKQIVRGRIKIIFHVLRAYLMSHRNAKKNFGPESFSNLDGV